MRKSGIKQNTQTIFAGVVLLILTELNISWIGYLEFFETERKEEEEGTSTGQSNS